MLQVFINISILFGYISNYKFSKMSLCLVWCTMLKIGTISSVLLAIVALVMSKSLHWLVMQGKFGNAKKVFDKMSDSKEEALLNLTDIKKATNIPQDCNDGI